MRSPGSDSECNGPPPVSISTCPDTSYPAESCRPQSSMSSGSPIATSLGPSTAEMAGTVIDPSGSCAAIAWQRGEGSDARAICRQRNMLKKFIRNFYSDRAMDRAV